MKPNIRLSIATPCTESWNQMTPGTQGRFCGSCQKTVVDFTAMTDRELLRWFAAHQGPVCGRLMPDQLGRSIAAPAERLKGRWHYWHYLIAGLLFSADAAAQTNPAAAQTKPVAAAQATPASAQPVAAAQANPTSVSLSTRPSAGHLIGDTVAEAEKPYPSDSVRGRVVDAKGVPISYASVIIYGSKGVITDDQGYFAIPAGKLSRHQQLIITAVGYQRTNIAVDKLLSDHRVVVPIITIPMDQTALGEVVVVKRRKKRIPVDTLSLIKDTLASVGLARPALTAYPNPVARGTSITVSARLDHTGKYSLQLYTTSGALVESRELEPGQTDSRESDQSAPASQQQFPIPPALAPGIYFLKLSHPAMTKCYSQQIVVY